MDFYDVVNRRRTIRDFEDRIIPQEVLMHILDAGLKGPSGDHLRDVHFVVMQGQEKIAEIVKMVGHHAGIQLQQVKRSDTVPRLCSGGC